MSDRLYLRDFDVGVVTTDEDLPMETFLTFAVHHTGPASTITRDEAESLRDKLNEWLSGDEHTHDLSCYPVGNMEAKPCCGEAA